MSGELARAALLLAGVLLLGWTAVGLMRAALGATPWSSVVVPLLASLALIAWVWWAGRDAAPPAPGEPPSDGPQP